MFFVWVDFLLVIKKKHICFFVSGASFWVMFLVLEISGLFLQLGRVVWRLISSLRGRSIVGFLMLEMPSKGPTRGVNLIAKRPKAREEILKQFPWFI